MIIGAGQVTDHPSELSPSELMVEAARRAAADAGTGGAQIFDGIESIGVIDCMSWAGGDPGRALAGMLGVSPRETSRTLLGGNSPLGLLGDTCERIQGGHLDSVLMLGAEAMNPLIKQVRQGIPTGWGDPPPGEPDRLVGMNMEASAAAEMAAGLMLPVNYYPFFENAIRAASGEPAAAHMEKVGRLWARFADVASRNPNAWAREFPSAEEITTVGPDNRMVSFPYTKLMTANINVDQGAALLMCSVAAAEAAGVPPDRWVFPVAVAGAHDHWLVGERDSLVRSPAIAACGELAMGHAGVGIDDISHVDIYSCFPSAVQVSARELGFGLEDSRPPTVTGGLTFAGGPASNYVTHSLAAMTGALRAQPGGRGLVTAVGWYLTKHAVAVLSSDPPEQAFAAFDPQDQIDSQPRREIAVDYSGAATIESYTALYGKEAPTTGTVSCLLEDGRRAFAKSDDADAIAALIDGNPVGLPVQLDGAAGFEFA